MDFLKKHKFEIVALSILVILYFASRLYNILSLPIFTDEAIYVRWAQIAKNDANWRFISLTDGKQPMLVWLAMISMRFIEDPLLAGRLVSVAAGFFTLIGLFLLGREILRNKWVGILSSFLYAIYPMALVYDRMALYESLVGAFSVWGLYLTVLLVRKIQLDIALILGLVIGGGVLTKTSAFFNIYLLPLSLLLFDFKRKEMYARLFKWLGLAILSTIIAYGVYSILRLSPFFNFIEEKNSIFVYPFKEWIEHPFNFFIGNWKAVWDWLTKYMTFPVLFLVVGSFFINKRYFREKILLLVWFLAPAVALAVFGKTLYPRFIFFMTLSLLPLIAFSLLNTYLLLKNRLLFGALLVVIFALLVRVDYLILNNFARAPIPRSDLDQYINSWPAGGGVKEAVEFFRNEAKKGKIYIATQGTFGLMPYALEIYLVDNPNIKIEGYWPIGDEIPAKVLEKSKKVPTYFVFYQPCQACQYAGIAPDGWNLDEVVIQHEKTNKVSFFSVYRIK